MSSPLCSPINWDDLDSNIEAEETGSGYSTDTRYFGTTGIPMTFTQAAAHAACLKAYNDPERAHQLVLKLKRDSKK